VNVWKNFSACNKPGTLGGIALKDSAIPAATNIPARNRIPFGFCSVYTDQRLAAIAHDFTEPGMTLLGRDRVERTYRESRKRVSPSFANHSSMTWKIDDRSASLFSQRGADRGVFHTL
jgi:hypothetical protein